MEIEKQKTQDSEIKLDRKSKILFIVLGILIVGSVAATYWRYMVKRDYIIEAQIDCDPETENCFIWRCDPMSLEEGEKCTGVADNDTWYYKILRRNAKNIPLCDPKDENCTALTCPTGESECEEILCAPENAKKGEECSNPEQYLKDNPPEEDECDTESGECEEEAACEEGNEECALDTDSEECAPDDESCNSQDQPADQESGTDGPPGENDETAPAPM